MRNDFPDPGSDLSEVQPVHLLPRFVERIWGTHTLSPYFPPCDKLIGEVWLTAQECQVEGGPFDKLSLGELAERQPEAFGNADGAGFPLLIKLLFPREKLSVQVHPDDAQARATLGQARGKTECWYVLAAEPGAQVALGFREPLTAVEVQQAVADGSLESRLRMLPVQPGDMVFVDAGTVHAIGPGVVLLETQQYSDVTYRLWDYGRGRDLHVDEGLAVLRPATQARRVTPVAMGEFERLLICPFFTVDRFRLAQGAAVPLGCAGQLQILVAAGEGAAIRGEARQPSPLPQAHAVLLPAAPVTFLLLAQREVEVLRILGPAPNA